MKKVRRIEVEDKSGLAKLKVSFVKTRPKPYKTKKEANGSKK